MKIRRTNTTEAPDINFIPLIDVLLVIVIFLVCTTTFIRKSQLNVELPGTQSTKQQQTDDPLVIRIGKDGNYATPNSGLLNASQLQQEIRTSIKNKGNNPEQRAVLEADSQATHQSVVTAMDILAAEGISRVSIATASKSH